MAANTVPIFGRTADVQLGGAIIGSTAVTATNGTGALASIYQADATEGSFVDNIVLKPVGGSTAATVCRIFLNSTTGAFTPNTSNTAANTHLLTEVGLIATTASNNSSMPEWVISIRRALPPGWRLLASFGTSTGAAGVGYVFTTFGSKY